MTGIDMDGINWEKATQAVMERLFDYSIEQDRIDSLDKHAAGRIARAAILAAISTARAHGGSPNE